MKLIIKFNGVLLIVGALGFAATAGLSFRMLQAKARAETLQNARLMLEAATGTRNYTDKNVRQLLETQIMTVAFAPEAMPSFAATEAFNAMRKTMPAYTYKEAVLNPTNPRDRTSDWEADLVNQFRQDPTRLEAIGERDTPIGRSLYLARPITITDRNCLSCHDSAAAAPKTLIAKYGSANGFGWKLHETIGAQIVSVPTQMHTDNVRDTFIGFMTSMAVVFAAIVVVLNLMLSLFVIRPLSRLSASAERVSLGDAEAPAVEVKGADEMRRLGRAFNRMRTSLRKAFDLIERAPGTTTRGA